MTIEKFTRAALSFEEVEEKPHFEKTSFRIKSKIFATLDTSAAIACVKLTPVLQSVYCAVAPEIIYPVNNKWGKQGWTLVALKKVKQPILMEILAKAYETTAGNQR